MKRINPQGFTLIEILIAMVILAVVGALMVTGLRGAINTQRGITQKATRLGDVQMAVAILERDLSQYIDRPILMASGTRYPSFQVNYVNGQLALEFTHGGWVNPNNVQRSTLQRVRYALAGDKLVRTVWPVLDRAPNTPSFTETFLNGVTDFSIRVLEQNKPWSKPAESAPQSILSTAPLAVELNLEVRGFGKIKRVIPLSGI